MELDKVIVKDCIATHSIKFGFDLAEKCGVKTAVCRLCVHTT
jgi:hypothetical protein